MKYAPILESTFRSIKKSVGKSWMVDETYIKLKGQWTYPYRVLDKENQAIDFFLSPTHATMAAQSFFEKEIDGSGKPDKVNTDKSGANLAALEAINEGLAQDQKIAIRQVKYLNNGIEQDHRGIKRITQPMLGFKNFICSAATLAGIELYHML